MTSFMHGYAGRATSVTRTNTELTIEALNTLASSWTSSLTCDFRQFHSNNTSVDRPFRAQQTAGLMLRFTILACALALSGCDKGSRSEAATSPPTVTSQAPAPVTGTTFGAGVKQATTVSIDKILEEPAAFGDKVVRV